MIRTILGTDHVIEHKLDIKNAQEGSLMPELVRFELQQFDEMLAVTSGIWAAGDGLEYQQKERELWG